MELKHTNSNNEIILEIILHILDVFYNCENWVKKYIQYIISKDISMIVHKTSFVSFLSISM